MPTPKRFQHAVVALCLLVASTTAAHPHHEGERTPRVERSTGALAVSLAPLLLAPSDLGKSTARLRPERVMDVLEFEIGVEIGSRAFEETYKSDLDQARKAAESLVANLDRRFLASAGVKHRLGKVVIRTDRDADPLRDRVRRGDKSSLDAFRDYWNRNPNEVGKTHDLAVYHVYTAPSGVAYVNTVGGGNRYALSCGRGATSWADGTIAHEFGHSWALHHNNKSGFFYESRPRNGRGVHAAGGNDYHVSIMHGGGQHNVGRVSSEEANRVYKSRQERRRFGDLVKEPGPIAPFGQYDRVTVGDAEPVTIDVVANDYDCNNEPLDAGLLDTVSYRGGAVELSEGTGPGGRNELVYTPPEGYTGEDFFHYVVFDPTGRRDWGAVHVDCLAPFVIDVAQDEFNYDLGPATSTAREGWTLLSPKAKGDVSWSVSKRTPLESADRGAKAGANLINQDFVYSRGRVTLNHKLGNGVWLVTLNLGDATHAHDRMTVRAEGRRLGKPVDAPRGEFPYVTGEVRVTDGELNLRFSDGGGRDPNWVLTRLSLKRVGDTDAD